MDDTTIKARITLTYMTNKHVIVLGKTVMFRCQPIIGHTLLIDGIYIELISSGNIVTNINTMDVSSEYDMEIMNTTYYPDIDVAEFIDMVNDCVSKGWEMLRDGNGLFKAQEEQDGH